jgi:proline dehydrogenase
LCSAGEDEASLGPTISYLQANGVRTIIDYAAEDDVEAAGPAAASASHEAHGSGGTAHAPETNTGTGATATAAAGPGGAADALARAKGVVGRVYRYEDEAACDRHVGVFKRAIEAAGTLPGPGFAAIKMTALGNPLLLERMSSALLQVRELFLAGDTDGERPRAARATRGARRWGGAGVALEGWALAVDFDFRSKAFTGH